MSDKVVAVDRALDEAGLPHAIGGAIALAYYGEPRTTIDVDINVFRAVDRWPQISAALSPLGVGVGIDEERLRQENEIRLDWSKNAIHLFFPEDALHQAMPASVREVPFAGGTIPIVSPEHLLIRKAMLDRPKDWLDIEAILAFTEPLDLAAIRSWLNRMVGPEDERLRKLEALVSRLGM